MNNIEINVDKLDELIKELRSHLVGIKHDYGNSLAVKGIESVRMKLEALAHPVPTESIPPADDLVAHIERLEMIVKKIEVHLFLAGSEANLR